VPGFSRFFLLPRFLPNSTHALTGLLPHHFPFRTAFRSGNPKFKQLSCRSTNLKSCCPPLARLISLAEPASSSPCRFSHTSHCCGLQASVLQSPNRHQQPTPLLLLHVDFWPVVERRKTPQNSKAGEPTATRRAGWTRSPIPARILWGVPHLDRDPPQPNPQEAPPLERWNAGQLEARPPALRLGKLSAIPPQRAAPCSCNPVSSLQREKPLNDNSRCCCSGQWP
jgi:hypothetical protein